ncbi:hypothetical protein GCM10011321_02060 [Youhaiella tibetensis]|jgi:hypothetical protein|uniref:Uncharacterized protein n=1 Tax=Paradevosia tibetensis TaxID=1447062 RepID=A0A5B9DS16_9HYPH|nr:hypothetical protein [Youhaiella tibetensis]AKR56537.1 hypothetical protein XM25_12175 [Devosia sp. H5989]QEE21579.1 hypothetical protein FNA67_15900 [Youhaiella tibetensis]GGF13644.1 hypothetical protein GCM10011321_02060 [Youhaiella tibetensis]
MYLWAKAFLRLGLVLLAIGILPAVIFAYAFPQADPLIPALLSLTVAPLGAFVLAVSVILFLVAVFRRRR